MGDTVRSFYSTASWKRTRNHVVARDSGRCTVARLLGGTCSKTLSVHHILPRGERPDLAYDPDNLATVCTRHHPQWEATRGYVVRARSKQIDKQLERELRFNAAVASARKLAGRWTRPDTEAFNVALDKIEKRHRVTLPYLFRQELVDRAVLSRSVAA